MTSLIVLAALAAVPVILIVFLRVNAAIAFMSLCLGSVLVTYTTSDAASIASGLASHPSSSVVRWISIALLLVPFILATLFTRKNVKGKAKHVLNFIPALATGVLLALLVTPLLGGSLQNQVQDQELWHTLDNLQTAILLGGAFFSLLFLLITHRHHHEAEGKHAKH